MENQKFQQVKEYLQKLNYTVEVFDSKDYQQYCFIANQKQNKKTIYMSQHENISTQKVVMERLMILLNRDNYLHLLCKDMSNYKQQISVFLGEQQECSVCLQTIEELMKQDKLLYNCRQCASQYCQQCVKDIKEVCAVCKDKIQITKTRKGNYIKCDFCRKEINMLITAHACNKCSVQLLTYCQECNEQKKDRIQQIVTKHDKKKHSVALK